MFKHPSEVCMTYFEHFKLSIGFSYKFIIAAIQAFIHAVIPDIYVTSTSDTINEVRDIIEKSGCRKKKIPKYYDFTYHQIQAHF